MCKVPDLPASKNRAPTTSRTFTTAGCTSVEMGFCVHGFCHRVAVDPTKHNSIWVIVDRLTKSAHFIAMKNTWTLDQLARAYLEEIVRLRRVPSSIVSDRDTRFQFGFWQKLQEAFGMLLRFSTAFHLATDGQTERTIQALEDMLRACALDFKSVWDEQPALIECSYNNSYHASISMAPYEALYGRKYRTPLCW